MDIATAIREGDSDSLRRLLAEDPSRANALVRWGARACIRTHPLHFVSDVLFNGHLEPARALPLVEALLEAGADVNGRPDDKSDTPLIGAASLGAEDVGIRLLDAGARPDLRGRGGETALHWAALLGEDRLAERLIPGSDLDLKDSEYHSPPLGWAFHGRYDPPAGNRGRQCEVAALLVAAGAKLEPQWLQSEKLLTDDAMRAALEGRTR